MNNEARRLNSAKATAALEVERQALEAAADWLSLVSSSAREFAVSARKNRVRRHKFTSGKYWPVRHVPVDSPEGMRWPVSVDLLIDRKGLPWKLPLELYGRPEPLVHLGLPRLAGDMGAQYLCNKYDATEAEIRAAFAGALGSLQR